MADEPQPQPQQVQPEPQPQPIEGDEKEKKKSYYKNKPPQKIHPPKNPQSIPL